MMWKAFHIAYVEVFFYRCQQMFGKNCAVMRLHDKALFARSGCERAIRRKGVSIMACGCYSLPMMLVFTDGKNNRKPLIATRGGQINESCDLSSDYFYAMKGKTHPV